MDSVALRVIPVLLRIDARRPASWLALVAAVAGGWWLAMLTPAGEMPLCAAALGGAILAVAALGDLPLSACAPWGAAVWAGSRAVWPAVGVVAGAAARLALSGVPWQSRLAVAIAGLIGIVAATVTVSVARRSGASAADAASLALVAAGAAAACGWLVQSRGGDVSDLVVVGIAAIVCVAVAALVARRCNVVRPARALRTALTLAAMATALVGMVAWLFLDPDRAALDLAVSLAWFVALAVPAATLGDGVSHLSGWRLLGVGRMRALVVSLASDAAILAWPPLVAAAVMAATPERSRPALVTLVALATAALLLLAVAWASEWLQAAPETGHAAALVIALLGCMAAASTAGQALLGGRETAQPASVDGGFLRRPAPE